MGVYRVNKEDAETKKKLKVLGVDAGKPKLRYYPNNAVDDQKNMKSTGIHFNKD